MKDMFGNEIIEKPPREYPTLIQQRLGPLNYRPCETKERRCKTCAKSRHFAYNTSAYYKCEILGRSHCSATDVRANHVCDAWELEDDGSKGGEG